jgi:quercetin dioxygenase-like cupin family protein
MEGRMDEQNGNGRETLNRREFSAMLPMLMAAAGLMTAAKAEGQAVSGQAASQTSDLAGPLMPPDAGLHPRVLKTLAPGKYEMGPAKSLTVPRQSHAFCTGMIPVNIRLEAHFTHLEPGCPPEPVEHHLHSEMWCVHEGTVNLMTNGNVQVLKAGDFGIATAGTGHSVYNASATEPASYFVISVGPPE